jgi:hypothetical protein
MKFTSEGSELCNGTQSPFPEPLVTAKIPDLREALRQMLLGALIGMTSILILVWLAVSFESRVDIRSFLLMVFCFGIGFVPSLILHELGHAILGWFTGMKMLMVNIGPLSIVNVQGQARMERLRGARGFLGLALFVPRLSTTRFRMALFVFGGPFANFAQGALLLLLASVSNTWIAAMCSGLAVSGFVLGAINLVPFRTRGVTSDGAALLDIFRGGKKMESRMKIMHIFIKSANGEPLESINFNELDDVVHESEAPTRFLMYLFPHAVDLQKGKLESARANLIRAAEHFCEYPEGMRQPMALQTGVYLAIFENNADLARSWFDAGKNGIVSPEERAQSEAVLSLIDGKLDTAKQHVQAARAALPKSNNQGWAMFMQWQLQQIENRIHAAESKGLAHAAV